MVASISPGSNATVLTSIVADAARPPQSQCLSVALGDARFVPATGTFSGFVKRSLGTGAGNWVRDTFWHRCGHHLDRDRHGNVVDGEPGRHSQRLTSRNV